jgi:hypothetical protein
MILKARAARPSSAATAFFCSSVSGKPASRAATASRLNTASASERGGLLRRMYLGAQHDATDAISDRCVRHRSRHRASTNGAGFAT